MITLREGEKIHLIKRRHQLILKLELLPGVFIFFVILVSMILLLFVPLPSLPEQLIEFVPSLLEFEIRELLLFSLSFLLLIFWQVIWLVITNYYLDSWIVTNKRTIHTELRGLFSRIVSSVPHDRIQDITIDIHGILPTVLRFGDLHIQTAGEFREFIFRQIPDPYKTKEIIFKARREFQKTRKKDDA